MFDYDGFFGLQGVLSWGGVLGVSISSLYVESPMVGATRYEVLSKESSETLLEGLGSVCKSMYGSSLFFISLLDYIFMVGSVGSAPYGFCASAHFSHNMCLSGVLWFSCIFSGMHMGVPLYLSQFVVEGLSWYGSVVIYVFEVVSVFSRVITLGGRLTMNVIAGKLLLSIGSTFLGSMVVMNYGLSLGSFVLMLSLGVLVAWEMLVGVIQGYIFVFLVCSYLTEVPNLKN